MVRDRKLLPAGLLSASAMLAALSLPGGVRAQNASPSPRVPNAAKAKPLSAAAATLRFQEAQTLREAYLALASGDHDYDGHRVKAMEAVKAALNILDRAVLKHGTQQQQSSTTQGQAAVANALTTAKQTPKVHENQTQSDKLLQQAAQLLGQVRTTLVQHKQQHVLTHVDTAAGEITTALKIR